MKAQGWLGARLTGRRALIEWGLVAALTAVLVGWLSLSPTADRADNLMYDALIRLQDGPADESVVIVAIDDRSLNALGRWPWPREVHAALIDRLAETGPRAVAYDVLFTEPEAGDAALAAAVARAGRVRLPLLVDAPGQNGAPWQVSEPSPELVRAAAGLGHVNMIIDGDGVVRRAPLYMQAGPRSWAQLILPLAEAAGDDGITVLSGRLPIRAGRHDLCLKFTQKDLDPMWGVDWVRVSDPDDRRGDD